MLLACVILVGMDTTARSMLALAIAAIMVTASMELATASLDFPVAHAPTAHVLLTALTMDYARMVSANASLHSPEMTAAFSSAPICARVSVCV